MWTCPVCQTKNNSNLCTKCGYECEKENEQSLGENRVPFHTMEQAPNMGRSDLLDTVALGGKYLLAIQDDGKVLITSISPLGFDINLLLTIKPEMATWTDIISVAAGESHVVGLKSDGTVVATGDNWCGMCNVQKWKDIVSIKAYDHHTVGLKADGTVVAVGNNRAGCCNVSDWKDIVAIAVGEYRTVGLKSDGTVVAVGEYVKDRYHNLPHWTDVVAIASGNDSILAVKADGTVVFDGGCSTTQYEVSNWRDIAALANGLGCHIGLRKDGSVVTTGYDHSAAKNWSNMVSIFAYEVNLTKMLVGLRSNGILYLDGFNSRAASKWEHIRVPAKSEQ